jgi:hypothetical protein
MAGFIRVSAVLAGSLVAACGDDRSDPDEHASFVGTWECNEGATVSALCTGTNGVLHQLDESYTAEIQREGDSELRFTAQRTCVLQLAVDGRVARALPGQVCKMLVAKTVAEAHMESFELRLTPEGTLENRAFGSTRLEIATNTVLDCERFDFFNVVLSPKD